MMNVVTMSSYNCALDYVLLGQPRCELIRATAHRSLFITCPLEYSTALHPSRPPEACTHIYCPWKYDITCGDRWKHKIRIGGPNLFQLLKLLQKHLEKRFPFPHRYPTATCGVGATSPLRSFIPIALDLWLYPICSTDWPSSPPFHCQSTKATFIIKWLLIPPSNRPPFFPKATGLWIYHFNMSLAQQVIYIQVVCP